MYRLTIDDTFSAAHAIVIKGWREPLHGHDWRVRLTLEAELLDEDGLMVDFHAAQEDLRAIIAPFRNTNLNETPPFDKLNPTAERVAAHIATVFTERLQSRVREAPKNQVAPAVRVRSVRVTEAVGCAAVYFPPQAPHGKHKDRVNPYRSSPRRRS
ncbi:MAG: 6-pyruvoyl trahydropterin synthase family protein [Phycisphaerales bacterium]